MPDAAATNDTSSLQHMAREEYPALLRFFQRTFGDESLAEDLTQKCFLVLLERKSSVDKPRSFLWGTARRLVLETLSDPWFARRSPEDPDDSPTTAVCAISDPTAQIDARRELERLGEDPRNRLLLLHALGTTDADVAALRGASVKAAAVARSSRRRALREGAHRPRRVPVAA